MEIGTFLHDSFEAIYRNAVLLNSDIFLPLVQSCSFIWSCFIPFSQSHCSGHVPLILSCSIPLSNTPSLWSCSISWIGKFLQWHSSILVIYFQFSDVPLIRVSSITVVMFLSYFDPVLSFLDMFIVLVMFKYFGHIPSCSVIFGYVPQLWVMFRLLSIILCSLLWSCTSISSYSFMFQHFYHVL